MVGVSKQGYSWTDWHFHYEKRARLNWNVWYNLSLSKIFFSHSVFTLPLLHHKYNYGDLMKSVSSTTTYYFLGTTTTLLLLGCCFFLLLLSSSSSSSSFLHLKSNLIILLCYVPVNCITFCFFWHLLLLCLVIISQFWWYDICILNKLII